jgi:hypothetical protein
MPIAYNKYVASKCGAVIGVEASVCTPAFVVCQKPHPQMRAKCQPLTIAAA